MASAKSGVPEEGFPVPEVVGEGAIKPAAGSADIGEGTGSVEEVYPKTDVELGAKAEAGCDGAAGANADCGCVVCAVEGKVAWPNTDPVAGVAAAKPEGCAENAEKPPPPKGLELAVVEPKAPDPGLIRDDCPKAGVDCAWSNAEVVWGDCPKADLGAWPKADVAREGCPNADVG